MKLARVMLVAAVIGVAGCAARHSPPAPPAAAGGEKVVVFDAAVATTAWSLGEVNGGLPSDWTGFEYLVVEFRATSSQRFELGVQTKEALISKRVHPMANVWVRASIPLRFYREPLGNAGDLAATVNQPRKSYWINIEGGGNGPLTEVRGMAVTMRYPVGSPRLEIRSVTLAKTDPGDAVLEGKPVVDALGQYVHAEWAGKAKGEGDLKAAWAEEARELMHSGVAKEEGCAFGGFASARSKFGGTGFFRVERIDGRWWFVCPEGHLFYSTGVNGIGPGLSTPVEGREDLFAALPAPPPPPPPPPGQPATQPGNRGGRQASFYFENLKRRFGEEWRGPWAALTARRLEAWGINTSYGSTLNDALEEEGRKKPYVMFLRWQVRGIGPSVMGLPDVYSEGFVQGVEREAERQVAARRRDAYLLGYFVGNEPPWPGRESQFVDLVMRGEETEMKKVFAAELAKGDSPEKRRALVLGAFERYLAVINAALKRADPNHLNLGIRFGGTPPMYVVKLAKGFDVYSLNKYRWEPPGELISEIYAELGKPMLIGEFHIGVPGRGMAPGLVQAMNQEERGVAYRYYVEHAAAHPEVIGTHWFQWIDQPSTGRGDGENYNIGWVDVTDRPYEELVEAAKVTHGRLLEIHSGRAEPVERKARASEVGTPGDARLLGVPAIQ